MATQRTWKAALLAAILVLGLARPGTGAEPAQEPKDIRTLVDPGVVDDPKAAAAAAAVLESAYRGRQQPESVRMLIAILRGSRMGPGEGWFGPASSRYSWAWLAEHCGVDPAKGAIPRDAFRGSPAWLQRLDRNRDGAITPDDLDWSERSPMVQMSAMTNRLFRRLNAKGDGHLTREELIQFFEKAAGTKDYVSADDFREALLSGMASSFLPGDAPAASVLVRGLFAGEIGSMNEGPRLGQPAPNFTLKTADGGRTVELAKLTGSKPVVLILGNFTCGPFRALYPEIEAVHKRFKNDAHFLMVYVREAHPTDGWKMESNTRAGVAIKQPTTFADRTRVASQFCQRLRAAMPVVVDEINDPVGHAFSGMPGRLYVIDGKGTVAYKSGRGPFGFKAGEMEQALVMCLLEQKEMARKQAAEPKP